MLLPLQGLQFQLRPERYCLRVVAISDEVIKFDLLWVALCLMPSKGMTSIVTLYIHDSKGQQVNVLLSASIHACRQN